MRLKDKLKLTHLQFNLKTVTEAKVLKTIKADKLIYELKTVSNQQQSLSCIESNKCQEMLATIALRSGFGQLLSHPHEH